MTREEAIEDECAETVKEILQYDFTGGLSKNGIAYQFTISTKKFIWNDNLLKEVGSALCAHECGFWAEDNEQNVYFLIFDHYDYLFNEPEDNKTITRTAGN